jgi:hypothetical protein
MADLSLLYGSLTVSVIEAKGLKDTDGWGGGSSDPYVKVYLDNFSIVRTKTVMDNNNPYFGEGEAPLSSTHPSRRNCLCSVQVAGKWPLQPNRLQSARP